MSHQHMLGSKPHPQRRERGLRVLSLYASGKTYREISIEIGVTMERVRQIANQHRRYLVWKMNKGIR